MNKAICPKCGKWAEGELVIEILFGFRSNPNAQKYYRRSYCKECQLKYNKKRYDKYECRKCKHCNQKIVRRKGSIFCSDACAEEQRAENRIYNEAVIREIEIPDELMKIMEKRVIRKTGGFCKPRTIPIDILEGLNEGQKAIVKYLVEKKNYSPMGFTIYTDTNEIYYFGREVI